MTMFGPGSRSGLDDVLWFRKEETAMAPAQEHCQWVTMMRQWMLRLDDSRTAGRESGPAVELDVLAPCEDVAGCELV